MATNSIPVPSNLNIAVENRSCNWELFKQTWTYYEIATALTDKPENVRMATLLSIIGPEALRVFNAFTWQQNEEKTVDSILQKFESYCQPKRNVSYERFIFMSRKQKKNESFDDYIIALKNLVKSCDYEHLADSLVRDAIIMGVNDKKIQEVLLRENNPGIDKCINIARASERARQHAVHISNDQESDTEPMEVDKVHKMKPVKNTIKCKFCGTYHKFGRNNCPAYGKKCSNCNGNNHFQSVCMRKNVPRQQIDLIGTQPDEEFELH